MSEAAPACRVCGCTEERACDGGCWWVPDPLELGPLCSSCLPVLERVRNALAALDGHTCHAGHTDADHLAMYRGVVAEISTAVGGRP